MVLNNRKENSVAMMNCKALKTMLQLWWKLIYLLIVVIAIRHQNSNWAWILGNGVFIELE